MHSFSVYSPLGQARLRLLVPLLMVVAIFWPLGAQAGTITVDGSSCTLPDAITAANANATVGSCTISGAPGAETLLLTAPTYAFLTGVYALDGLGATPTITSTLVISGGVDGAIVERTGLPQFRLFQVGATGDLTLENVTVRGGSVLNDEGGAIYSLGKLTVVNSRFYSNTAFIGGAISGHDVMLIVENSDFGFNRSESAGGGLFSGVAMTATIRQSVFHNNEAETGGGGAYLYDNSGEQTARVIESQFLTNTAYGGAGLFIFGLTSYLTDTLLVSNTASIYGGGMSITGGKATVTRTDVYSNTAGDHGAGVHVTNADITYRDSLVRGNSTPQIGGGLMLRVGVASITKM